MPEAHLRERLAAQRVARLATSGPGGPHIVPICFALEGGFLYSAVDSKPKSGRPLQRLANVRSDPRVAVLADHYEEDWGRLWWLRVDGRARILEPGGERDRALGALSAKYEQYLDDRPEGPVLAVALERWRYWSAG